MSTGAYSQSTANFNAQAGPGTTPNFLLAGYFRSGAFRDGGSYGYYWSSTSYSNTSRARSLVFSSSSVNSADYYYRYYGSSVRCLFNTSAQSTNSNQSANSSQSVTPSQAPTSTQSISNNTAEPSRTTPLAMSAPTQNATPATSQDDSTDTTEDSADSAEETTDSTSTTTSPQGVISEQNVIEYDGSDLYGPNQNPDPAINLAFASVAAATAGVTIFLLAKRKKDEDEENQPTE